MGRLGIRQLCVFVLACGVYSGGLPRMVLGDLASSPIEAPLAWLLMAAVYASWRQPTSLAVHGLCVVLGLILALGNPDVSDPLGRACWAASLISFPVSLALLALSAARGRRIDPRASRLARRSGGVSPT